MIRVSKNRSFYIFKPWINNVQKGDIDNGYRKAKRIREGKRGSLRI